MTIPYRFRRFFVTVRKAWRAYMTLVHAKPTQQDMIEMSCW